MTAPQPKEAPWLNLPLFPPPITWQAPNLTELPSWRDAKRVCVDIECRDDDLFELGPGVRRGGYVCGIAFAIEDGPSAYLPIRHEGGGNLPEAQVWSYLRDQAATFEHEIVGNSLPYDLDYLWENGVEFKKATHRDVQNAGPILDELQRTYNLDAMCGRYGVKGKDEAELRRHATEWGLDPKTGMWRLHAGAVGRYGEGDVRAPLQLLRVMEKDIAEQGLQATFDLESKVTCPLVRMTRRGIRVDMDELDQVETWAKERLQSYIDQIHHLTGITIGSISNGEEVAVALRKRGLNVPTKIHAGTGKRMHSVTKLWLQQQTDDVAAMVISGREFAKLLSTYVGGFRKHMIGDRLHPSFKQLRGATDEDEDADDEGGARFGRCSSKHPNVQAQMKRSKEILKRWRKVLVADRDAFWVSGDFSSQEPRWTVHYAEDVRLRGASAMGDKFREDRLLDPYQVLVDLVGCPEGQDRGKFRDDLKEVYLGRCYGMGGGKMAQKLKLPTEMKVNQRDGREYLGAGPEAQAIIDAFDRGVPYVKALARLCSKAGEDKGYIRGYDGRRIHFEKGMDGLYRELHKGLNKLIQYAAAMQTKLALVELDAQGYELQLTVHDEFDYSETDDRRAKEMAEIMCGVIQLRVPTRVDVKKGSSYGQLEKLCTVTSLDVKEAA